MINWPQDLIQDIARRRAIAFLGAGVSANSLGAANKRPPDWHSFLQNAITLSTGTRRHLQSLLGQGDFLTVCEIVKMRMGHAFDALVKSEFQVPGYQPAPIHDSIFKLDLRLVLTQNFDKIYDTYSATQSNGSISVKCYNDTGIASIARDSLYSIIKAHGTIDRSDEMIFTRSEYAKARHAYPAFYKVMDALALTHTFLFIGCGFSDPDVRMLLERQAFLYGAMRPHYIVTPSSRTYHAEVISTIERNMSLKVLKYSSANNHQELTDSMVNLVVLADAERIKLANTMKW